MDIIAWVAWEHLDKSYDIGLMLVRRFFALFAPPGGGVRCDLQALGEHLGVSPAPGRAQLDHLRRPAPRGRARAGRRFGGAGAVACGGGGALCRGRWPRWRSHTVFRCDRLGGRVSYKKPLKGTTVKGACLGCLCLSHTIPIALDMISSGIFGTTWPSRFV